MKKVISLFLALLIVITQMNSLLIVNAEANNFYSQYSGYADEYQPGS